jgi:hypothetical protein
MDDTNGGDGRDNPENMSELDFESFLAEAIEGCADIHDARVRISTFSELGLLTTNRGLVVRIGKTEFPVTIVRSR